MSTKLTTALLLCLTALLLCAPSAGASAGQLAVFQDDREMLGRGDAARARTLDEVQALGVDVLKLGISWSLAAPRGARKPRGFDGANPGAYDWAPFAAAIQDARARGLRVMVTLGPSAPGWATKRRGDRVGVDRPSAREYGRFVEAAGRRFPDIDMWTFWNEPNHPGFLYPQTTRRRVPYSPHLYRSLVAAGVAGLRRSGNAGDRILFGELLPIGKRRLFRKNTMKPLRFLREFFCFRRSRACRRFRRVTGVNGFAYHPYTRPNGPRGIEPSPDDATVRSFGRITRTLDAARRRGRVGGPRLSVWNTEFGFQSNPPDRFQTRLSRIPAFLNESEWISYRNRRVATFSQYTMTDTRLGGGDVFGTWQGGLRFANGRIKGGVYEAFRSPLFVRLLGPSGVEVWGAARPAPGGPVQVEQRSGRGGFSNLGGPIRTNGQGYFRQRFRLAGAARRTFRFRYSTAGGATFTSRTARALTR